MGHADPLGTGHVTSLSRPGGNITGLSIMMTETSVKSLELLKQAVPGIARVSIIFDPATLSHKPALKAVGTAGSLLGLQVQSVPVPSEMEFGRAFLAIVRERADAVLVLTTPLFITGAKQLVELTLTHKLPSMFGPKSYVVLDATALLWPAKAGRVIHAYSVSGRWERPVTYSPC